LGVFELGGGEGREGVKRKATIPSGSSRVGVVGGGQKL